MLRSEALYIGQVCESFHVHGNFPEEKDKLNKCGKGADKDNAHSFKSLLPIVSGPDDFLLFRPFNI